MGKIRILENSVALKIAAGEVIDRPASVLRELLDNAIDAGSTEISVYIESAGMKEIRVTDNGTGMDKADIEICVLPHATSKIESAEDLYRIHTLGFRGEALSSIASSSRLEIITSADENSGGYILRTDSSGHTELSSGKGRKGTTVSVRDLFYAFPARKQFLKSPSSETSLCKSLFFEKAVARPDISFRLYIDSLLIQMLPPSSLKDRVFLTYNTVFKNGSLLYEAGTSPENEDSYSIKAVLSDPALFRKDRKYIHIYLNGRRIQEYSLIQAVVYGYSEFLPGGHYPCAVLFIENSPELVDFNIHPAKKEAKIKNLNQIHHSVTEIIKKTLSARYAEASANQPQENVHHIQPFISGLEHSDDYTLNNRLESIYNASSSDTKSVFAVAEKHCGDSESTQNMVSYQENDLKKITEKIFHETSLSSSFYFRYLGQLFNIFILCERDESLYIIDQHAAHEKSIYESFINSKPLLQKLLVPVYLPEDMHLTEKMIADYKMAGIILEKDDTGSLFIDSLPEILNCVKRDIIPVMQKSPGNADEVRKRLYSTASCKMAVKGGDELTESEALAIIKAAFSLKTPYCPHGRPVWKRITKKELLEQIERII